MCHDQITGRLVGPVRDDDVRIVRMCGVTVRAKDEVLAVTREHRERIERTAMGNLLEVRAILVNHKEIELAVLRVFEIR